MSSNQKKQKTNQKGEQKKPQNKEEKAQRRNRRPRDRRRNKNGMPRKTWGDKKLPADEIMKLAGGQGVNSLAAVHREKNAEVLAAVNQDVVCDVTPATTSSAIQSFALGIILAAKKRGLNSFMDSDRQWQAYGYICDIVRAAIKGETLEFTAAPRWFVEIMFALRPKNHKALTATIGYEMIVIDSPPSLSSVMTLGTGPESYSVAFGNALGPQVNGFQAISPASPYDPQIGKEQFAEIWMVFPAKKGTPTEMVSPLLEGGYLTSDCSAFALNTSRLGTGYYNPGGINNRLENEVHIDCPILSRFCQDNDISDEITGEFRAGFQYANGGGTACYLGPRCLEFEHLGLFKNKGRQVFKFYDLLAYFEVLSLIIGSVLEKASRQNAIVSRPYPLTVQQTLLMLRQALIPFFNNEMAQDLRLKNSKGTDPGIQVYLPCTVGDNGCTQTVTENSPLMPAFFTEMVKGASRVTVDLGALKGAPHRVVMDHIPILSVGVGMNASNYTWDNNGNVAFVYQELVGEVPVSPVDCSAVIGNTTYYLDLNGTEISKYIAAHNEWMTAHSAFLTTLTKLSASTGSPLFSTIFSTQYVCRVDPPAPVTDNIAPTLQGAKMQKQTSKKAFGAAISTTQVKQVLPVAGQSPTFAQRAVLRQQSNIPFFKETVKYSAISVTPVFEFFSADVLEASQAYIQSVYGEFIKIPFAATDVDVVRITNTTAPTLYSLHAAAAQLDVKTITSSGPTELENLLATLDDTGGGGFLTTLGKILQTGGQVAAALGGILV